MNQQVDDSNLEKEDAEFDAAWDETDEERTAATGGEEALTRNDEHSDDNPDGNHEEDGGDEFSNLGEDEPKDEGKGEPDPGEPGKQDDDIDGEIERTKQELKSWQGRLKKAQGEFEQFQSDHNISAEDAAAAMASDDAMAELSDDEQSALQEFMEEYPETLHKAIGAMVKQEATRIAQGETRKVTETIQDDKRERHEATIDEAHPDWREIGADPKFREEWIDSLPHKEAVKYQKVIASGTAKEIISMLNVYKKHAGEPDPGKSEEVEDKPTRREEQLKSAQAVKGRPAKPVQRRKVDKNDFDGAWDEATS